MEVDNTIKKICQWIDRELEKEETSIGNVTDMVSALAALIAASQGKSTHWFP